MATWAGARKRGEPGPPGEPGRPALYFCGSIRGGREDRELYGRIVSRLRRFGTVLTEHVAAAELGARGEATRARGAGCRTGRGQVPAPSPKLPSAQERGACPVPLRYEPSLRAQLLSQGLLPSWRTFFCSFQGRL